MNNSSSELEQLTLTLNHFASHLHLAAVRRRRLAQLAPDRALEPPSHSLKTALVSVQTHLELVGLLDDHLQLSVFAQAGAAHLGHLLLLRSHQWLVLVGVTWGQRYLWIILRSGSSLSLTRVVGNSLGAALNHLSPIVHMDNEADSLESNVGHAQA